MDRRTFVAGAAGVLAAARLHGQAQTDLASLPSLWDVDRSVANLENAYWGAMPPEVYDEYIEQTRLLNRTNVVFVRDAPCSPATTPAAGPASGP